MMKVGELINKLSKMDPDSPVVGYLEEDRSTIVFEISNALTAHAYTDRTINGDPTLSFTPDSDPICLIELYSDKDS